MKKLFIPTSTIVTLFACMSCAKIETNDNTVKQNRVELRGIISNVDDNPQSVKSNYDLDGSTGTFYWTGVEKIGILNFYNGPSFWEDEFTSTTSANSKETSLVFSGTPSYDGAYMTDYALYPIWNAGNQTGIGWSSSIFKLYIPESQAYNSEAPLKDVVPMIAKKDGDGNYAFQPITAVIEVNVKNLPTSAQKITLSSDVALSGYYRLTSTPANYAGNIDYVMSNGLTVALATNDGNTTGKKTITFESGLGKGEYSFYFPVSVGTLPNLSIVIKDNGDNVLQTVSYSSSITTARGRISRLPLLDLAKATIVKLTGSASAPFAYVEKFGPDAHIKYAIAATEDAAKTAAATGSVVNTYGEANKFSIIPSAGTAGYYYLGYQVLDSSDNVLMTSAIKFCYSASDPAEMVGTYAYSSTFPWATETVSWTFAESDDFTKGNIKITATSIWSLVGNIYGVYDGSKITFDGRRTVFRPNNRHCIIGRWDSATNTQGSNVGELIDVVFTKAGSNLTTSKIGIGYDTSDLVEPLTTVYLSSRYFPDPITWVKQP